MGIGEGNYKKYYIYIHNIKRRKKYYIYINNGKEGKIMKKKETYKHGGYG